MTNYDFTPKQIANYSSTPKKVQGIITAKKETLKTYEDNVASGLWQARAVEGIMNRVNKDILRLETHFLPLAVASQQYNNTKGNENEL